MLSSDETGQDALDEIIYQHGASISQMMINQKMAQSNRGHGAFHNRGGQLNRGAHNLLSSIPEESSIKEMDIASSSIITDNPQQQQNANCAKLQERTMHSLIVKNKADDEDYFSPVQGINHRRFGKNGSTKLLGGSGNQDESIRTKTIEH